MTSKLIANVIITTLSHLVWLLGVIFIFGLLLYFFARFTRAVYTQSAGEKLDIILTGWIGTPVHELGHALFCILFRHKIVQIKLYTPGPSAGSLGFVSHTYNQNSRYQKIGNFFIGIGPILFGTLTLYALLYFLMPDLNARFSQIAQQAAGFTHDLRSGNWRNMWNVFCTSTSGILGGIFDKHNITNWRFWLFLYLSFCIASHMELSPPDIKGALSGLITIVITMLFINFVITGVETLGIHTYAGGYWQYFKLETYASRINGFLALFSALLTYALIISALNFFVSYIGLTIYNVINGRGAINPFLGHCFIAKQ